MYGRLPRYRLSEDGVAQAEMTARALAREPLSVIYTSPMLRARQTARIIAAHHPGVPVKVDRLLIEVQTGYQGRRWAELGRDANLYEPLLNPGDESIEDVGKRMEKLIRRLVRRHEGETVSCVSHADPVMIGKVRMLGKEMTLANVRGTDYPERASVTRLIFHPDGSLDTSYESPAQELIKPYEYLKEEAPAEASGQDAVERDRAATSG